MLEPVYEFTLEVPTENVGKAMADIQYMSGSFNPPELEGDFSIITGTAPVSTMHDYTKDVIQYTHGKGKLVCNLKGYEPCHNSEEVMESIGYDCDGDVDNTCDSVFCSKGAGYNVKWDKVKSQMHLTSVLSQPKVTETIAEKKRSFSNYQGKEDLFALDNELMQILNRLTDILNRRKQM